MGVWLGPTIGKMNERGFSFTGQYIYRSIGDNWEIALLSSGIFRFKAKIDNIDAFIVGGGSNGQQGTYESSTASARGGTGGDSGAYKIYKGENTINVSRGINYTVVIGENGETGKDSSFGTYSSSGGEKQSGGAGAGASHNQGTGSYAAGGGHDGIKAFNESDTLIGGNTIYASSGAGGAASSNSGNNFTVGAAGSGGSGAGDGGTASAYNTNPGNGTSATTAGSGGGGAGATEKDYSTVSGSGGSGASGIIIIRNHRS